jgi:hypothetical protein
MGVGNILVAAALALTDVSASAITVFHSFNIVSSNYSRIYGPATPVPIDPVHFSFSISFDPGADIAATSVGLTVNAFDLPYTSQFTYSASQDLLAVASAPWIGGCYNPTSSYCIFIDNAASASPHVFFAQQQTSSNGYWSAQTIKAVPEPASWALFIAGFGVVGTTLRRQRYKVAT